MVVLIVVLVSVLRVVLALFSQIQDLYMFFVPSPAAAGLKFGSAGDLSPRRAAIRAQFYDYPQKYMIILQRTSLRDDPRILRRPREPVQLRDAPDGQRVRRVRKHAALHRSDEATGLLQGLVVLAGLL